TASFPRSAWERASRCSASYGSRSRKQPTGAAGFSKVGNATKFCGLSGRPQGELGLFKSSRSLRTILAELCDKTLSLRRAEKRRVELGAFRKSPTLAASATLKPRDRHWNCLVAGPLVSFRSLGR